MAECTIYDKLRYIAETKDLIKMAIESQDVEVLESATFRQYAEYITEIRKVSSVNGMQGDVVLTLEDLGGITLDALEGYYTKEEVDNKGYITAIPETYITEDELSTQLADKVSETALNEALNGYYDKGEVDNLIENVDVTEQLQNYYTKEEIEAEFADTLDIITEMGEDIASLEETKQDKLTQGTGIKIEGNVISLDYSYDLFEVVTELPTENISDNKIYLVQDTDGGEGNSFVEYIYVNGQFEEVGKFKTTVDLTGYATEKWVSDQGYLTEVPDEYVTDTDLGEALDGYATEDWVGEQGFLTEHQSLEDYYTKEEVDEAIQNIEGGGGGNANIIEMTQEEYNEIAPEEDTLYVITDAPEIGVPTKLSQLDNDLGYVNVDGVYQDVNFLNTVSFIDFNDYSEVGFEKTYPDGSAMGYHLLRFAHINGQPIVSTGDIGDITIEGGGGDVKVIELTQAEYDQLGEYEDAFYVITDGERYSYSKEEIDALIGGVETKITEINNLI